MKQMRDAHWIVVAEEGDTPEIIARWIEDNVMPNDDFGRPSDKPYGHGDVDFESWVAEPGPGDVFVFQAPPHHMTLRFPGWTNPIDHPMSQDDRELIEILGTRSWETERRRTFKKWIVDMSTSVRRWFTEEV